MFSLVTGQNPEQCGDKQKHVQIHFATPRTPGENGRLPHRARFQAGPPSTFLQDALITPLCAPGARYGRLQTRAETVQKSLP